MMDENERLQYALHKRQLLERELRDAEIMLKLVKKNLQAADEYIKQLIAGDPSELKGSITKVTIEMELEICRLWDEGQRSFTRIGFDVGGLHAATVRKILTARGRYHPRKPITAAQKQEMIDRFKAGEGESVRAIAKDMQLSLTSVSKVLQAAGFETDWQERQRRQRETDSGMARQNRRLRTM